MFIRKILNTVTEKKKHMGRGCVMLMLVSGMTVLALAGCGKQKADVPTTSQTPEASGPEREGKRIEPLASGISLDMSEDCTFAASFENKDIVLNDEGAMTIHMTVYTCEFFDIVDIAVMQQGDVLVIGGKELKVDSVERSDRFVKVNGGIDGGGVVLAAADSGGYCETLSPASDIVYNYIPLGDVTLKVDQDFLYCDQSDIDGTERTYYPGDLLMMTDTVDFGCTARNCAVTVSGGKIVNVTRTYTP